MKHEQSPSTKKAWLAINHAACLPARHGFSLVEVILAGAVFALLVTALVGAWLYGQEATALAGNRARAVLLAEEGLEVARNIRDPAFANLADGTYGLTTTSNQWNLSGSSDVTDIFTRQVTISSIDTKRKSTTTTVTWQQNPQRTGSVSVASRLTNWLRNSGNWGAPTQEAALDLPTAANGNEIALYKNGSATYAIVVRSNGSKAEFFVIDVSSPASPIIVGSLNIGSTVNDVAVCGNYAVLAAVSGSAEFQVINLTIPASPILASTLDLTGAANALSVVCTDTTVFLGRAASAQSEVYAISIANPAAPGIISNLELGTNADATKVILAQNSQYLYVASPVNTGELLIVSVSNPSSISITGTFDAPGSSDVTAVTSFSTYAVLGRANGTILILDAGNPASPALISSALDIGTNVQDMAVDAGGGHLFVASNTATTPTFIIDVSIPASPTILGSVVQPGDTRGIVWDYDLNRAFTVGTANTAEFAVIKPN